MKKRLIITFIILFVSVAMLCRYLSLPVYDMRIECFYFNGCLYNNMGSTPCELDKVVARDSGGFVHSLICGKAYSIKGDKELYYIYIHEDGMTGGVYEREGVPDSYTPSGVFWGRVEKYYQDSDIVDMAEKLSSADLNESEVNTYIDKEIYVDRLSSDIYKDSYPLYLCYDGIAVARKFVGCVYKYNEDYYFLNKWPGYYDSSEEKRCYKLDTGFYEVLDKYWNKQ